MVAYLKDDGQVASVDNAVFAFEMQEGSERSWCLPVGIAEITVDDDDILAILLPNGLVAQDSFIFESVDAFLRNCKAVFEARAKRKAAALAEYEARKAAKGLL
jgi:hypothetical protein